MYRIGLKSKANKKIELKAKKLASSEFGERWWIAARASDREIEIAELSRWLVRLVIVGFVLLKVLEGSLMRSMMRKSDETIETIDEKTEIAKMLKN